MNKNTPILCEQVRRQLEDFVRGELPEAQRDPLQRHLAACKNCAAQEATLRALMGLLSRVNSPPPPPGLAQRALAIARSRMRRQLSAKRWVRALDWLLSPTPQSVCALAALAIILGLGLMVAQRHWDGLPVTLGKYVPLPSEVVPELTSLALPSLPPPQQLAEAAWQLAQALLGFLIMPLRSLPVLWIGLLAITAAVAHILLASAFRRVMEDVRSNGW